MNQVFRPYLRRFILLFFDDILVYSPDLDTHRKHLAVVLDTLRENSLFANKKKCVFVKERVEYLCHWICSEGVEADAWKIRAMLEWPLLKSVKELRGFLGLAGYYRRFVKDYGSIAAP